MRSLKRVQNKFGIHAYQNVLLCFTGIMGRYRQNVAQKIKHPRFRFYLSMKQISVCKQFQQKIPKNLNKDNILHRSCKRQAILLHFKNVYLYKNCAKQPSVCHPQKTTKKFFSAFQSTRKRNSSVELKFEINSLVFKSTGEWVSQWTGLPQHSLSSSAPCGARHLFIKLTDVNIISIYNLHVSLIMMFPLQRLIYIWFAWLITAQIEKLILMNFTIIIAFAGNFKFRRCKWDRATTFSATIRETEELLWYMFIIKQLEKFKYLGFTLSQEGGCEAEVESGIKMHGGNGER